jgi:predicted ABC-type ATPase
VNADSIAKGLSPFKPESVAIEAGRLMLKRLHSLAALQVDFAFETTLASRSIVPFLEQCQSKGYQINLLFLWVEYVELAIERVCDRVASGGHDVPESVIRRRYEAGRQCFQLLYLPLADKWQAFDNSGFSPELVASGGRNVRTSIHRPEIWSKIIG